METKKYDDVDFHDSGNRGLHVGMFMGWAMLRAFSGEAFTAEVPRFSKQVEAAGKRFRFIGLLCDGKLTSEDLTEDGRQFADAYYEIYLADYECTLDDEEFAAGSWEHFTAVRELLNERFETWTAEGRPTTLSPAPRRASPKPPIPAAEALAALRHLDKLDPDKRPIHARAERVLAALAGLPADNELRHRLIVQARSGKWSSAVTATRAVLGRFDAPAVIDAIVGLDMPSEKRGWGTIATSLSSSMNFADMASGTRQRTSLSVSTRAKNKGSFLGGISSFSTFFVNRLSPHAFGVITCRGSSRPRGL